MNSYRSNPWRGSEAQALFEGLRGVEASLEHFLCHGAEIIGSAIALSTAVHERQLHNRRDCSGTGRRMLC